MPEVHEGARGEMQLNYDFWESASGHAETSSITKLIAENDSIIILDTKRTSAQFIGNTYNRGETTQYAIEVDKLINLIIKHGRPVPTE